MKTEKALHLLDELKKYAREKHLGCLIVGSVGYRSAILKNEEFEKCDDIDCIFVYDDIDSLENCPYLKKSFLTTAKQYLAEGKADMFSTKLFVHDIQISADFISYEYLLKLPSEPFDGVSKYRIKLTDAVEKVTNIYRSFWGDEIIYQKGVEDHGDHRLYKLPIHYYDSGIFYPGVLLNKFLYNPYPLEADNRIRKAVDDIFVAVKQYCPNGGSILQTSYRNEHFSDDSRKYVMEEKHMKKRILVTGSSGFIGSVFIREYSDVYDIIGIDTVKSLDPSGYTEYIMDICDKEMLKALFDNNKFDAVIHTAAEKSLRICEQKKQKCLQSNYEAAIYLAELSEKNNAKFIFISSDQVFDGTGSNYKEDAPVGAINYYGKLKIMTEEALKKYPDAAICRTALVFGDIPTEQKEYFDSVKSMDTLAVQGYIVQQTRFCLENQLPIILPDDEYVSPTHVKLLAQQLNLVIEKELSGILHCCGNGRISRYKMGLCIAAHYGLDSSYIHACGKHDPLRPKDVSLDSTYSQERMGIRFPTFEEMLNEYM